MKHLTPFALAASLAMSPVLAQDQAEPPAQDEGFSLMEEGARLLLRGLMQELEPTVRDLEDLMQDLGPQLELFADDVARAMITLVNLIDDIQYYEAPVILENGDILMRRSPDAPPYVPATPAPGPDQDPIDL